MKQLDDNSKMVSFLLNFCGFLVDFLNFCYIFSLQIQLTEGCRLPVRMRNSDVWRKFFCHIRGFIFILLFFDLL